MSMYRIAAGLACSLLVTMLASAATRNSTIQIKVLDSETRSLGLNDNGVARNCDQVTFDAYCRSTSTAPLVNTLLVQEGDGAPFRISCTAESRFSRCIPLPRGSSFEARREKKGITVYYVDDKGKLRSQLYTLVAQEKGGTAARAAAATGPATAAAGNAAQAAAGKAAAAPAAAATGNAVQPAAQTSDVVATAEASSARQTVKCSFSSTPAGAEVTVDGRYVGSTPSVVGLTTGTHVVVVSTAGYAQWKRELAVTAGSELTVNAVLEKAQ